MALAELVERRAELAGEVNNFLQTNWGIDHYTALAPAVLYMRRPKSKERIAYPILLTEKGGNNQYLWKGTAEPEKDSKIDIIKPLGSGSEFHEIVLPSEDWVLEGAIKKDNRKHTTGTFRSFYKSFLEIGRAYSITREYQPKLVINFGRLKDPYTREQREIFMLDFTYEGKLRNLDQFRAAVWLMTMVKNEKVKIILRRAI